MRKLLVIAALLSTGTASADPLPKTQHMVRNIGFAEQGDTIVVRARKFKPAETTKPYGNDHRYGDSSYRDGCYYNQEDERVCPSDDND